MTVASVNGKEEKKPILNEQEAAQEQAIHTNMAKALGLPEDQVKVVTRSESNGSDPVKYYVTVELQTPGFKNNLPAAQDIVRAKLREHMPFLSKYVALEDTPNLVTHLKSDLIEATKNTGFDKSLLDWVGFNPNAPAVNEGHLDKRGVVARGYNRFTLYYYNTPPETTNSLGEKLDKALEAKAGELKTTLKERSLHYLKEEMQRQKKPEAEITAELQTLAAKFDALTVIVEKESAYEAHKGLLEITFLSPEEMELKKKDASWKAYDTDEIRASNPLSRLNSEQGKGEAASDLGKVATETLLHGPVKELLRPHAGSHEMHGLLEAEFKKIEATRPDLKPALDTIINNPYLSEVKKDGTYFIDFGNDPQGLQLEENGAAGHYRFTLPGVKQDEIGQFMAQLAGEVTPAQQRMNGQMNETHIQQAQHYMANWQAQQAQAAQQAAPLPVAANQNMGGAAEGVPADVVLAANRELQGLLAQERAQVRA